MSNDTQRGFPPEAADRLAKALVNMVKAMGRVAERAGQDIEKGLRNFTDAI